MAINRQDYQYIRNSTPSNESKISDGSLQVGDSVVNLIQPLQDYQVLTQWKKSLWGWQYVSETAITDGTLYVPVEVKKGKSYVIQVVDVINKTNKSNKVYKITEAQINPKGSYPTIATVQTNGDLKVTIMGKAANSMASGVVSYETIINGVRTKTKKTHYGRTDESRRAIITEPNWLKWSDNEEWVFNDYIHFYANEDAVYFLEINGLSFGYSLLGSKTDTTELRGFASPARGKVFMFESNEALTVDRNGIVTGNALVNTLTKAKIETSGLEVKPYANDELNKVFISPPLLEIEDDKIVIKTQDPIIKSKWKFVDENEKEQQPRLIIFRDFLTSTIRQYDDNSPSKRYGKLYTIQNTKKSDKDEYFTQGRIYRVSHPYASWSDLEELYKVTLQHEASNLGGMTQTDSEKKEKIEPTLGALSKLGSNWQHSINMGFDDSIRFKYTSVAFAWGLDITEYSPYSIPLILDRSLTDDDFVNKNYEFVKNGLAEYYAAEHVVLQKK